MNLSSVAIYSSADASSLHVKEADIAIPLGGGPASENYLDVEKVLAAAQAHGADAVFPGYGFLSESTEFAARCESAGITFIGPTSEQIRAFGLKHEARAIAAEAGVPLLPGTELLQDQERAKREAENIGYPVMLKSTAGGGGIGLTVCESALQLADAFDSATRLAKNNFGNAGVFIEKFITRARHVEVQIFGDGLGDVVALGLRDCSAQRRNQKVVEEAPAPNLPEEVRSGMAEAAVNLAKSLRYRSAGTVEFIYDADTKQYYFLEVNTRLQVEHGVTEQVIGVDIVRWMIETARGTPPDLSTFSETHQAPGGHSIEVRVYAESPANNFRPSCGLLTAVEFPSDIEGLRVDGWVATGVEVSPFYDPMLAKLMVHGVDRDAARVKLLEALGRTRIAGVETNLAYLRDILQSEDFVAGKTTTRSLSSLKPKLTGIEVLSAGMFSTIQDHPGRTGYWNVGIPPSGPMDSLALRLGNRTVGNPAGAPALEMTMAGPTLRFHQSVTLCVAGADMQPKLDGRPIALYQPVEISAGQRLEFGKIDGPGARSYLCVRGGFDVPEYLGSASTFTLGRFGGHGGRTLQLGDVLQINAGSNAAPNAANRPLDEPRRLDVMMRPTLSNQWDVRVIYGPHGAPDFFTEADIETFFATSWEVHYNSARTGVRLIGPKPSWARADGGEAGLHPSNIHDCAYAFGAIDYTGDMPIILGPDGPSLGGFVCPATVIRADLWKLGQLSPGDSVRFVAVEQSDAVEIEREQTHCIETRTPPKGEPLGETRSAPISILDYPSVRADARLDARRATATTPAVQYRPCGDDFMLVEYGPMVLDLNLRFRVHALMEWLARKNPPGIIETTPGIRSLQVHYDSGRLSRDALLELLTSAEDELPDVSCMKVPTRIVHLPLSWDDEATQLAIRKYTQLVRKDAPWAPSNIEFIRRINGLDDVEAVRKIVFDASYLVLGLGDVYLGAPVATPIDPRHRLVTTKYNPARTWTPENAVGIGGAYMCIYGMEGPGGYQFVGRTLQVYNRFRVTQDFEEGKPWLLRFFDQIRFFPVEHEELLEMRDAFAAGRYSLTTEDQLFDLASYNRFLEDERDSIEVFKRKQHAAFAAERQRWVDTGQLNFSTDDAAAAPDEDAVPYGCEAAMSAVPGSVWKLSVEVGDQVDAGQELLVLESMKMEIAVESPSAGTVVELRAEPGAAVKAGQVLAVIEP